MQIEVRFCVLAVAATLVVTALGPASAPAQEPAAGMTIVVPGDEQWEKPRDMPSGMRVMLLSGDPARPGPYVYRVRAPSGYKWPPMKHPDSRVTTVLEGTLWAAEGSRYDAMKMTELRAGATFVTPAGTPYYQWARTEIVLQVVGNGPIADSVSYVNPDDDPRSR
jgi:hypothetical protein